MMLGKNKKKKIICIGSAAKDIFFPTDEGQIIDTPEDLKSKQKIAFEQGAKYQVDDRFEAVGGCAANVSIGLSRLGIDVSCYSRLGDDVIGNWIIHEFKKEGVGTESLQLDKESKSDLSAIVVDSNTGERVIFFNRDANEKLEIIEKELEKAEWFFISALNGNWEGNLKKILEIAQRNSIKIAFNPGQRNIKDNSELVMRVVGSSEVVILNKDEAIELVSSQHNFSEQKELDSEDFLLSQLKSSGAGIVVLTDGMRGSWVMQDSKIEHREAIVSEAVDTTGSGDGFTSGFLAAYLKDLNVHEATGWGALNGSKVALHYGAIEGLYSIKEMQEVAEEIE